jgi:hypothetical protein
VTVEDCPIMAPSTPAAVAEAVGVDDPTSASAAGDNSLTGPAGHELLSCTMRLDAGTTVVLTAGPVGFDRNGAVVGLFAAAEGAGKEVEEVGGEAPGLDPDHVLALSLDGEAGFYLWVDGGFHVSLAAPLDVADPEDGLRALSVLVDEVEAALGA